MLPMKRHVLLKYPNYHIQFMRRLANFPKFIPENYKVKERHGNRRKLKYIRYTNIRNEIIFSVFQQFLSVPEREKLDAR